MEKIVYKRGIVVEEKEIDSESIEIDASRMGNVVREKDEFQFDCKTLYIDQRNKWTFENRAIYLSGDFDWVLCKDEKGSICLVPLRKEKK